MIVIVHTLAAIGIEASGPCYSVPRLCDVLVETGLDVSLAVLDWVPEAAVPGYVKRFPLGWGPRRLGRSPAMARWLTQQVRRGEVEVLHNHGLWMMPNMYPGRARRAGQTRLVVSPRGTLSEWAMNHHRLRKQVAWHLLGQGAAVRAADAFHATAESEYEDIRRLGFRQPVAVIPNGIDVPPLQPKTFDGRRRLLYLGRVHQIKGIDLLLRAWRAVQARFPDWELVIAGPDDGGELPRMQALAAELGAIRVSFPGPVYGEDKLALYRSAHLYVLPTRSENFAMTVAESLAAGTPVIVSKGAPWSGLEREGAGWWIEIGVDPLVAALEVALAQSPETLVAMGANGHAWMTREFGWRAIAGMMAAFYGWLLGRSERPAWVRLD